MGGPADDFDCTVSTEGERTTLRVRGEIDSYVAPALRECLTKAYEDGRRDVVVDLSGATFLDSSALGVLVAALKRFRSDDGDLRLASPNPRVAEVLDVTGLTNVFTIES